MSNVLAEMDDLMAELGLIDQGNDQPPSVSATTTTTQPIMFKDPNLSTGPGADFKNQALNTSGGIVSKGPGANISTGPGMVSTGPGMISRGPGMISNGPGMVSSGPGPISSGPGPISSGPGLSFAATTSPSIQSNQNNQQYSGGITNTINLVPQNHQSSSSPPMNSQQAMPSYIDGLGTVSPIQLAATTPDGRLVKANGPICGACNEMIIGVATNALGRSYHPEHFVCTYCKLPFAGSFVEHEAKLYCENDYLELFSPRCNACAKAIEDTCITALGNKYHPDCFSCSGCGDKLRGKPYKEEDGEVYCNTCKVARQKRLAAKSQICSKCKLPITGEYILLQGQPVHSEHYRCEECGCEFNVGKTCHEYEGRLYCYEDYQKQILNICGSCAKPIVGRSITALGKVWHPEHFTCTTCQVPFAGSAFREHGGKPYCESHYHQFFGRICFKCSKPVVDKGVEVFGKIYHRDHFTCTGCECLLGKEIMEWDGKPLCFKCYDALPKEVRKRIKEKKAGDKKAEAFRDKLAKKEAKEKKKEKEKLEKEAKKNKQ
ncbi:hypothetical protein DICPUDRAFT_54237 [Dictyostelium purpureum]|uniref:LIM zinc-binding domain-containing protein n=1 Tax=Dictyostelium purpureum TaxID=5786 RepID=F0ZG50_DICPU|nr:uncharacterized protein DICPUDRAFT_54237 [Dictyostelium purpureum]EGC37101.1 hypothetical protein DICPUDRAFT_54237 [Dictyostelium purpureum]|eukprot:XP_003286382.1 hypothetical protein DICPUDRAFT_54237 [Dictyostelium purpureum]